jgi:hypothetical protein
MQTLAQIIGATTLSEAASLARDIAFHQRE